MRALFERSKERGTNGRAQRVARKSVNATIKKKSFYIPIGPGAEESAGFQSSWALFLRSSVAYDTVLCELAQLMPNIINDKGRDMQLGNPETVDNEIFTRVIIPVAKSLGKLKAYDCETADTDKDSDEELSEEESESGSEDEDAGNYATPEKVKAAMAAAAGETMEKERNKREAEAVNAWKNMDDDHKSAYLSKLFEPGSESALQVKSMVAKARNLKLNPMLKWALREKAPLLVPVTDDIESDARVYKQSKALLDNAPHSTRKWPRIAEILFGLDEVGKPQFLYVHEGQGEEEDTDHEFTAFVNEVARQ